MLDHMNPVAVTRVLTVTRVCHLCRSLSKNGNITPVLYSLSTYLISEQFLLKNLSIDGWLMAMTTFFFGRPTFFFTGGTTPLAIRLIFFFNSLERVSLPASSSLSDSCRSYIMHGKYGRYFTGIEKYFFASDRRFFVVSSISGVLGSLRVFMEP